MFDATLDMLAGRYPAEEFAELKPRLVWDRLENTVRGRAGAQRLAVTSGGTIPDRGLFGVFLPDGTRVGELDEEMVYESRVGENFLLGASTWRIEDITFERVVVTPAPGQPGKMPFWHGDGPGRNAELGRAVGEFVRSIRSVSPETALATLRSDHALDSRAANNLIAYLDEQAEATGVVPDDRTLVVERFRDEIGDWRMCIHSPFGARVHAPWATVLRSRLEEHFGDEAFGVEVIWSDDGIVIRLPESAEDLPTDLLFPDPDEIEGEVVTTLPGTAAFAARFRECAARALLLPRRRPDRRTPLWQQRQRAADLLSVASKYPSFPMLLEATRECCNDVFDLPALRRVMADVRSRKVRVVPVQTPTGIAVRRGRCSSVGSPSTCTRATRRWPSDGRPRWHSTGNCSATCWVPRSCDRSWTPRWWPRWSSSSNASRRSGPPVMPMSSTTSCGCSVPSTRWSSRRVCPTMPPKRSPDGCGS